ncbi:hypothetical protein AAG906_017053 [Vitis piasezkii]
MSEHAQHLEEAFRLMRAYNMKLNPANQSSSEEKPSEAVWLQEKKIVKRKRKRDNSQLVIEHIKKEYEAKDERTASYLALVQAGLAKLSEWVVERVPRTENSKAKALAKIDATLLIKEAMLPPVYLQTASSITTTSICSTVELEEAKGKWVNELPGVLRAYWTILGRPTGTTLFAIAYGMEAVIPMEIGMPTTRTIVQGPKMKIKSLKGT